MKKILLSAMIVAAVSITATAQQPKRSISKQSTQTALKVDSKKNAKQGMKALKSNTPKILIKK